MADTAPITPRKRGPSPLVAALLLVAFAAVAYLPALHAGFIVDDAKNVVADPRMGSADGLRSAWTGVMTPDAGPYQPLTTTAFWVQNHFFGTDPMGYHAVNVLLHALNALLLWGLLRKLSVTGAWVAAAIFAVHPVHVETVAWVSELKSVLSTFFCLASAWCFVKGVPSLLPADSGGQIETGAGELKKEPRTLVHWTAAALIFFAAALLSRPAAALLPAALVVVLWWKRSLDRRALAALAPMMVMAAVSAALAVYLDRHGAAPAGAAQATLHDQWMLAGRSLAFYAMTLAWPVNLSFIHPGFALDAADWADHAWSGGVVLVLLALLAMSPWIGRGSFAAVAVYVMALAPITFLTAAPERLSPVADHWQYLASIPMIALGAAAGMHLWWVGRSVQLRRTAVLAAMAYVGVLGGLTWQRAAVFESPRALWTDTVLKNGSAWYAHAELARIEAESGNVVASIGHYQNAVELRPDDAGLHSRLGEQLFRQRLPDMAIAAYRRAVRLEPGAALPRANLGALLLSQHHVGEAIDQLTAALKINPKLASAHNSLGTALVAAGRRDEAVGHYRRAVEIDPRFVKARSNLANELGALGRLDEAIAEYLAALELTPESPPLLNNLAATLIVSGRPREAMQILEKADHARPRDGVTLHNMSLAARAMGDLAQAIAFDEAAVAARPDDAAIRHTLGRMCVQVGRDIDGIRHLRTAVTLQPFFPAAHADLALALATHPGTTPILAAEAAEHAQHAATQSDRRDPSILRVLALALALNGRFDESIMAAVEAEAVAATGSAIVEAPEQ